MQSHEFHHYKRNLSLFGDIDCERRWPIYNKQILLHLCQTFSSIWSRFRWRTMDDTQKNASTNL